LASLLAVVPPLVLAGCSEVVLLDPKGPVGRDERSLILTAAGIMLLVVVPVVVMTFLFAWRYRAGNKKARYEPKWASSAKIETVVWGAPVAIIIALATVSWITTHTLDPFKPLNMPGDPINIQVVSMDWKWLFIYPEGGVAAVNEVAFPTNTHVHFSLTSDTVMNSFFIPQLGSQIYTMAGMRTQLHLSASEPGRYDGIAANYSGAGFSRMTFEARAMSTEQFERWIAGVKKSGRTLDSSTYELLAKPSEDVPVTHYASVSPHLFDRILAKYATRSSSAGSISAVSREE